MSWLAGFDLTWFFLFTLVLTRVSGLVMTAPILGLPEVPTHVRALLAFALALVITPTQVGAAVPEPGSLAGFLTLVAGEVLVGVSLGLGVAVLLSGVHLAGQLIGRISGLMLADVFDPNTGESIPQFSKLLYLVGTAVFVTVGGHRLLVAGMMDTFQTVPLATAGVPGSLGATFIDLVAQSFVLGVRAAAPVVTALLLSTLVMGLISRTLPQLNILAVGFGMNSLLVFGVLGLTLGAAAWVFQEQVETALRTLLETWDTSIRTQWLS